MKRVLLSLCLVVCFGAIAEDESSWEDHRLYTLRGRGLSLPPPTRHTHLPFNPRTCDSAYASLASSRKAAFWTAYALAGTAMVATPIVISGSDYLAERYHRGEVESLKALSVAALSDEQKFDVANALARQELQWMQASQTRKRHVSERLTYVFDRTGNAGDNHLAYQLGELHDAALSETPTGRVHTPQLLRGPGHQDEMKRYLPIWNIQDYQTVRAKFFQTMLKSSESLTVGEALKDYLFDGGTSLPTPAAGK